MKIEQIYALLNDTQKQAWGTENIKVVDSESFVQLGDYVLNSQDAKDVWTGKLTDMIAKSLYRYRELTKSDLGIKKDDFTWGAVLRKVRVRPIELRENAEYNLDRAETDYFTPDKPDVLEQLYSGKSTYEAEITITDDQIASAFQNESEMASFISLIFSTLNDSMTRAEMNLDRLALCNFIAEKIKLQGAEGQESKTHAINLFAEYKAETGKTATVDTYLTDKEFLQFASSKMREYKEFLNSDVSTFNASPADFDYPISTPEANLKFYVNSTFDSRLRSYLYSGTYHEDFVKLDGYKKVDFWQGIKTSGTNSFDPLNTTKIHILPASSKGKGDPVEQSGIVAVMFDDEAVVSTYQNEKSESWRIPKKGTKHWKSNTHMYINDVIENGIVFYVEDIVEEPGV